MGVPVRFRPRAPQYFPVYLECVIHSDFILNWYFSKMDIVVSCRIFTALFLLLIAVFLVIFRASGYDLVNSLIDLA